MVDLHEPSLKSLQSLERGGRLFFPIFSGIGLPMILAGIEQTLTAVSLPAIAADLGNVESLSWIIVTYLIAATIAAPVYGRLGDMLGHRRMLIVSLIVFLGGACLCATASNFHWLLAFRVLQGFGGGGIFTVCQALLGDNVPVRERASYQGYIVSLSFFASVLGPLTGGLLSQEFGWRAVFYFNIPFTLLAILLCLRLPVKPPRDAGKRFDFLGLALYAICVTAFLVLLRQLQGSGGRIEVSSATIASTICALSFFAFCWRQKMAPSPLFDAALMRQGSIWRSNLQAVCYAALSSGLVAFLPLYLRVVHGENTSSAGLALLPLLATIGIGSIIVGKFVTKSGKTSIFPSIGLAVVTMMIAVFAVISDRMTTVQVAIFFGIVGLFMGTVFSIIQITVQAAAGEKSMGQAAGSVQLSRSLGAGLGAASASLILFSVISFAGPGAVAHFAQAVANSSDQTPFVTSLYSSAISNGFQAMFLLQSLFAFIAMLMAWTMPMRSIR
ncbi:MFS family permease [Neorhizobium galegae]|uniref:MFS transporter n=1 Tax=Neorhizobium galegae TaxID=399 RepID=UPI002780A416|nr:MFS transporter [Neorhizobium galegae]MDQ0137671.1 MFS family permease [Neorhizobium galegae]